MGYGTGAIMAVAGQDVRDWEFAEKFGLPIVRTVQPPDGFPEEAYTGDGTAINSAGAGVDLNGLGIADAKVRIVEWLTETGHGEARTQYKLRDWLFSRQRYWGEPFPIVYSTDPDAADVPIALPESMLPLQLPDMPDTAPRTFDPTDSESTPEPPLGRAAEWARVTLDLGDGEKVYQRELNVMPQWAGSCWYELRYLDPTNDKRFVDPDVERYWMGKDPSRPNDTGGVDLYVGGVEHAVLHLLYARFWHKVLYDLGQVSSEEPFRRLFNQGYIQAYAYTDERGFYVPAEDVVEVEGGRFEHHGQPVNREYGKMGKSLNNVVTPDEMCARYGADTFRMYEMGMGPLDISRPWQTRDVVGAQRYLQRLWRSIVDEETGAVTVSDAEPDDATLRLMHRTVAGVRADFATMQYNTAIAKLIVLNNHVTKSGARTPRAVAEAAVLMTAPLAPHIAEELWELLGHNDSLAKGPFPVADERYLVDDTVEYPVQIRGKVRGRVTVASRCGCCHRRTCRAGRSQGRRGAGGCDAEEGRRGPRPDGLDRHLMLRIALAQFEPDADPARNAARVSEFAGRAAAAGTRLLVLPEGSLVRFLDDPAAAVRCAQPVDGEFGTAVVDASRRHGIAVAAGMFTPHAGRARNTLLVADRGELVAVYHKVHLYDAFAYLESDLVEPGTETPPVVEIDGLPIGFATCYDLRFPELFRVLVDRGAQVLAVASAWVAGPLKEEHWLTLLRARAIENTSYVVAADQSGRKGIGRSAAFDPMGLPLLDLGTADGVIGVVDVSPDRIAEVRHTLPALQHRRFRVADQPG